jgi:hypothetical protein
MPRCVCVPLANIICALPLDFENRLHIPVVCHRLGLPETEHFSCTITIKILYCVFLREYCHTIMRLFEGGISQMKMHHI